MPRAVTLVTGPPCSGKSWLVRQQAGHDDPVVCLDELARQAGSPRLHNHQRRHYELAHVEYGRLVRQLAETDDEQDLTAWVVRTAPDPAARARLARAVRATRVLVLLPPRALCLARADQRDADAPTTRAVIDRWFARYRPGEDEETVRPGLPTW